MFELWIPLYLPIILIVIVGGYWWSLITSRIKSLEESLEARIAALEECCETVDDVVGWLKDGTATEHSVAHWIALAHDAICTGNTNTLCGGGGGAGTNPPSDPPPF